MADVSAIATAFGVLVALAFGVWEASTRRRAQVRAQADQIGAWMLDTAWDFGYVQVKINNSSQQPVYDLASLLLYRSAEGDWRPRGDVKERLSVIAQVPPGVHAHWLGTPNVDGEVDDILLVEIAFTDQAGHHWRRTADGKLRRLRTEGPIVNYGLTRPVAYSPLDNRSEPGEKIRLAGERLTRKAPKAHPEPDDSRPDPRTQ